MKKSGSEKKEAAPVPPLRSGKAEPAASGRSPGTTASAHDEEHDPHGHHHKLHMPNLKNLKGNCKDYCGIIFYVVLGIITILVSAAVIAVTGLAAVATKTYDTEQSSRLVAMIVLAVTAAITLSMVIYAIFGAFRKHSKSVHSTGVVLIILAIIQALIIGLAIQVTEKDQLAISKSLGESYRLAHDGNLRHEKVWDETQKDLQCCGLYGPEDYRDLSMPIYHPPNVPISCCPTYDPKKPAYNQQRQRESCKGSGTYYSNGCKGPVIEVFKTTSVAVIGVIVVLIVLEVLVTILGAYLNKKRKQSLHDHHDHHDKELGPVSPPPTKK